MYSLLRTRLRLPRCEIVKHPISVKVAGWRCVVLIVVAAILIEVALTLFMGLFYILQYGDTFEVGVAKGMGVAATTSAPMPLVIWSVKRRNTTKPQISEVVVIGLITVLLIALSAAFNGFIYDWAGEKFRYGATFSAALSSVLSVIYFFTIKKSSAT